MVLATVGDLVSAGLTASLCSATVGPRKQPFGARRALLAAPGLEMESELLTLRKWARCKPGRV